MRPSGIQRITASRTGRQISPNRTSATSGFKMIANRVADMRESLSDAALPCSQPGNVGLVDVVSLCQNSLRLFAKADRGDIGRRKLPVPMVKAIIMTAFHSGVLVVLVLRAYTQMLWVNARRGVACVQDYFPLWDWANKIFIGVSVGANRFLAGEQKNTVPVVVCGAGPQPASWRLVYPVLKNILRPEQLVSVQRSRLPCSGVAATAQLAANNFSIPAFHARDIASRLVGHGASIESGILFHIHGGV